VRARPLEREPELDVERIVDNFRRKQHTCLTQR